ncbi:MAG: hypothetical protein AB8H47_25270 [Bacteroidia bacterium]
MIRTLIFLCLLTVYLDLSAQDWPHDQCEAAKVVQLGELLPQENNQSATTTPSETPEKNPITCIKTFENDLWYRFTTEEGYTHYEVVIDPTFCNTPAGLQAMVIRADECDFTSYEYKACVNPYAEQALQMVWREEEAGVNYLIYVDGYDGTHCSFKLRLMGYDRDPRDPETISQEQNDYDGPPPILELPEAETYFQNNEAVVRWTAQTQDDTRYFVIQSVRQYRDRVYGYNVGTVEAINTVGSEETAEYEYIHNKAFSEGETYCYRIVELKTDGSKAYSEPMCFEAALNEDFFISPVYPSAEAGIYVIKFRNFRKQNLAFSVLDQDQNELKSLVRAKEPKGDGTISINMSEYEPGTYYLKVLGKEERYLRAFVVE